MAVLQRHLSPGEISDGFMPWQSCCSPIVDHERSQPYWRPCLPNCNRLPCVIRATYENVKQSRGWTLMAAGGAWGGGGVEGLPSPVWLCAGMFGSRGSCALINSTSTWSWWVCVLSLFTCTSPWLQWKPRVVMVTILLNMSAPEVAVINSNFRCCSDDRVGINAHWGIQFFSNVLRYAENQKLSWFISQRTSNVEKVSMSCFPHGHSVEKARSHYLMH